DSVPAVGTPAGVDTMPEIEHVVVLMLENHSYDNLLGLLGRGHAQTPRGDGFTMAAASHPANRNPYPNGRPLRAFRMPTTCQPDGAPSQEWEQSHIQYAGGHNDGFVVSNSGPVAMGYWTGQDLPFTYDLASTFPIGDRWFCSALAQTDPNRRFLIAATASGMTDDIGGSPGNLVPDASLPAPANGTIFERLSSAGISWIDYCASFPTGSTIELCPTVDAAYSVTNVKPIAQFFTDAAVGRLPSFSLLDPDYGTQSQEDPQNIVVGEAFLASVVKAVGSSPAWRSTLLIVTYDQHDGYYDHVPPPPALAPDSIAPMVQPGEQTYDGYARYGSNDLNDFLDLSAIEAGTPTFPELPALAASGDDAAALACSQTGPGTIPPPEPASTPHAPKLPSIRLRLRDLGLQRHRRGLLLELRTSHGTLTGLEVELRHNGRRVARARVAKVSPAERKILFTVGGRPPETGRYTVRVTRRGRTLLRRELRVG
ncbi:MAG TPA: alkaline phosphatase family protein, partial [Solirubrobacteraceae bacterium]